MRPFEPMLAASGRPSSPLTGWVAEPKFDGWRAMVEVDDDRVCVTSRNGHDLSDRVPIVSQLAGRRLILDGELIFGAGRLTDFYGLLGALHKGTAVFVAFDVLAHDGRVLVTESYDTRRSVLESLDLPGVVVTPSYYGTEADALLSACEALGFEGLVLKWRRSIYRPGQRTADWRKVKCGAWREHLERRMADHH